MTNEMLGFVRLSGGRLILSLAALVIVGLALLIGITVAAYRVIRTALLRARLSRPPLLDSRGKQS